MKNLIITIIAIFWCVFSSEIAFAQKKKVQTKHKDEAGNKENPIRFLDLNTGYGRGSKGITAALFYSSEKQHYKVYGRYYPWNAAFIDGGLSYTKAVFTGGETTWMTFMARAGYRVYKVKKLSLNVLGGLNYSLQELSGFEPTTPIAKSVLHGVVGGEVVIDIKSGFSIPIDGSFWKSLDGEKNDDLLFTIGIRKRL